MDRERRPLDGRCHAVNREVPVRLFAVIVAALALCSFARAASTSVLHRREHRQVRHLSAYVGTVRFFDHHRWLVRRPPTRRIAVRELRVARVWIRVIRRELAETRAALRPKVVIVGHFAGWSCITNGAYAGAPHEGNGYNGAYTGPLGMTTPWAGYMPPGSDWVHSPVAAVYAIAERVAAQHGWSWSWMRGQWPNTFPPCAGLFG